MPAFNLNNFGPEGFTPSIVAPDMEWVNEQKRKYDASNFANYGGRDVIANNMAGIIPEDVRRMLTQRAAERGIGIGSYGGGNADTNLLRSLGLTSLDLRNKGFDQYNAFLQNTPAFKPEDFYVSAEKQADLQAKLFDSYQNRLNQLAVQREANAGASAVSDKNNATALDRLGREIKANKELSDDTTARLVKLAQMSIDANVLGKSVEWENIFKQMGVAEGYRKNTSEYDWSQRSVLADRAAADQAANNAYDWGQRNSQFNAGLASGLAKDKQTLDRIRHGTNATNALGASVLNQAGIFGDTPFGSKGTSAGPTARDYTDWNQLIGTRGGGLGGINGSMTNTPDLNWDEDWNLPGNTPTVSNGFQTYDRVFNDAQSGRYGDMFTDPDFYDYYNTTENATI